MTTFVYTDVIYYEEEMTRPRGGTIGLGALLATYYGEIDFAAFVMEVIKDYSLTEG